MTIPRPLTSWTESPFRERGVKAILRARCPFRGADLKAFDRQAGTSPPTCSRPAAS